MSKLKSTWFFLIWRTFFNEEDSYEEKGLKNNVFCNKSVHAQSLQKRSSISNSIRIVNPNHKRTTASTKLDQYPFFKIVNSILAKYFEYQVLLCESNIDNLNYCWAMPTLLCNFFIIVSPNISTLPLCSNNAAITI